MFSLDNRYLAPLLITCILLVGQLSFGILESYHEDAAGDRRQHRDGAGRSGRIFYRQWPHLASAYITGISVGILIRSPAFWPYALCSAISITSKYVLRVKGRHLWNPSNFGISAMLFLAAETVASLSIQWGNYCLADAGHLGARLGDHLAPAALSHHAPPTSSSFLAFALLRSWITGSPWQSEVAPITGPMYQLFIFFMITDPKTTVRSKTGQCVVAFVVALVEMVLRLHQVVYAPFYALFIVGPDRHADRDLVDSRRARSANLAAHS